MNSIKKKTIIFLNYMVTLVQWSWKTKLPSHPMLTSFPTNSSNPNRPNLSKPLTSCPKILLNVAKTPTNSTHRRIGILFQPCTMYKWIDNHCVVNGCNFICTNNNEVGIMHHFNHAPTWRIWLILLRNRFDLQHVNSWSWDGHGATNDKWKETTHISFYAQRGHQHGADLG